MPKTKKILTETIMLRLPEDLKYKLENIAEQKERSLSGQIRAILKDYLDRVEI